MPEWMHNRAEHILAKNPDMPKSEAFAIATQQGHALGKNPKGYGTERGRRVAKRKFDTPKDDVKKANPGNLGSSKMASMRAELAKMADLIAGGKADDKTDKDFDKEQLRMGRKVEREHTSNPTLADEIARDHLEEIPDYYTRLARMEASAPKRKEAMDPDHPYLLDQVGKPKTRNLSAMPPDKSLVVKTGALSYHGMRTALGAGLGAAAGAGLGAAHAEPGHRLHDAIYGAAAGGTIGGTVGYVAPKYLASRAGTINRRTGEMVVAPSSRMEALRHVGQAARHDIGTAAQRAGQAVQGAGQQLQQTGNRMQYNVRKELVSARPAVPAPSQMVTGAASPMALAKAAEAKLAFTESMYSGGTSIGGNLVNTNIIPPFRNPPVKTAGPPSQGKDVKLAAMVDELMKLNAVSAITPAGRLAQSRKVGMPKTTAPPGPSIAQIAKPVGYGSPEPGTTKTGAPYPKAVA